MEITEFFIKYNKKFLDFDGGFGNQCVDVTKAYFTEVLGKSPHIGNAIDYWNNPPQGFQKVTKTLLNRPNPGDILVWGTNYNPIYGHVAICNWSRFFDVGVFEQNFPVGSPCGFRQTDYRNVLGWLRPIAQKDDFTVVLVNSSLPDLKDKLRHYAQGRPNFIFKDVSVPLVGPINGDDAKLLIDQIGWKADAYLIFYPPTPTSTFEVASYYPEANCSFATIPDNSPNTIPVHAMLHCIRKYLNFNHIGPYVEDVEKYPTSWADSANFDNPGWAFAEQYKQLVPYFKKM